MTQQKEIGHVNGFTFEVPPFVPTYEEMKAAGLMPKDIGHVNPDEKPDLGLLHIHAQETNHAPAFIIGNKQGLRDLFAALTSAINGGSAVATFYTADGEGYDVTVKLDNSNWLTGNWAKRRLPYVGDEKWERDNREDAMQPWNSEPPKHFYIGREKRCGCLVAATTDIPGRESETATDVAEMVKGGLAVEGIYAENVKLDDCKHGAKK
jgi:hypothetical protein